MNSNFDTFYSGTDREGRPIPRAWFRSAIDRTLARGQATDNKPSGRFPMTRVQSPARPNGFAELDKLYADALGQFDRPAIIHRPMSHPDLAAHAQQTIDHGTRVMRATDSPPPKKKSNVELDALYASLHASNYGKGKQ